MSLLTEEGTPVVERRYDSEEDRLFLIYYALPPGFNRNKWSVSDRSYRANIRTAINKPVIVYRKNPSNPFHADQEGNFVHPKTEQAAAELGHPVTAEEYFDWQEKFAVGRIRNVDLRDKGYAWTLEITDPEVKQILKSEKYSTGIPGWTSPQILTYPAVFPNEDRTGVYDHWVVSHVILTDNPAFGFDKSALAAKCVGTEKECLIKTKNASQESIGFCTRQATIDLIDSRSSQKQTESTFLHNTMSQTETPQSPNNEVVVATKTLSEQNQKQEGEQQAPPAGSGIGVEGDAKERERDQQEEEPQAPVAKSLDEANTMLRQQGELIKDLNKQLTKQDKRLEQLESERKMARLSYIIPRDLFKSDESHLKKVQETMNENISESWLTDYWKTKRELYNAQNNRTIEKPLVAKSASLDIATQYQPQDEDTLANNLSSTIERELNLPRKMFEGGTR